MNKIDLIIDALSVAQNSVWSMLNQEALAYAVELKLELAKPERKYPNHETYCGTCGACTYKPSTEPPDYVEPPTSDYHNGWEEGFEAAKNLFKGKNT